LKADATTAVGIDGCRGGWIAAICRPDGSMDWLLEAKSADILKQLPEASTILVDMIIGLPDRKTPFRQCDLEARTLLRPHGSRVFSAPPREALTAESYPEACELARGATGKAISKQCWHLFPKIRELDAISDPRVRESHPELVFTRLNGSVPVGPSKKSPVGQALRLNCLEAKLPHARSGYDEVLRLYPRKDLARDDAIDALALCAVARHPEKLRPITADPASPQIWH